MSVQRAHSTVLPLSISAARLGHVTPKCYQRSKEDRTVPPTPVQNSIEAKHLTFRASLMDQALAVVVVLWFAALRESNNVAQ